ncbi:hypothetical protein RRF57_007736 [Xylaria bambusicola]|uniref:Uncharacterized protein n=1 Tax=Xylaria bambusicola TaxID=326684 RepID=A0AAN7UU65_9PEZI
MPLYDAASFEDPFRDPRRGVVSEPAPASTLVDDSIAGESNLEYQSKTTSLLRKLSRNHNVL